MVDPIAIVPANAPATWPIREVAIPFANNVTSSIRKPTTGDWSNRNKIWCTLAYEWTITSLSHEDPQQNLHNFFEISDTYIPTGVSTDYV